MDNLDFLTKKTKPNFVNSFMFCQAYLFVFLDVHLHILPKFIKEQVLVRHSKCQDCFLQGQCISCGCSVPAKFYQLAGCNSGRWGRLLSPWAWQKYKIEEMNRNATSDS